MDLLKGLKALADETRLNLLELLKEKDYCVNALADKLGVSASAVSQHLKVLREARLVRGRKMGYWVHYSIDREGWKEFIEAFNRTYGEKFLEKLEKGSKRCCRKAGAEEE